MQAAESENENAREAATKEAVKEKGLCEREKMAEPPRDYSAERKFQVKRTNRKREKETQKS